MRHLATALLLAVCLPLLVAAVEPGSSPGVPGSSPGVPGESQGLVKTKPTEGRFVETPQGFIVPYVARTPGTDVLYRMQPIPGGKGLVGSPASEAGRQVDEGPQFEVTVEPFWMAEHEVTWAE